MKTRFLSMAMILAMLVSLFALPVSAAEAVTPDAAFNYTESQDVDYVGDVGQYAFGTDIALGDTIPGTNWRVRNEAESPDGIRHAEDDKNLYFGVNSRGSAGGGYPFITARAATVKYGADLAYTTAEAAKIPAIVLDTDLTNLSSNQRIYVEVLRIGHGMVTPGVRFMTHNNGQNYYALILPGSNIAGTAAVELVKSVDGVVTTLATFDSSNIKGFAGYWMQLEIIINNGTISFTILPNNDSTKALTGSYTDADPYTVSGNDAGVWLMATNGGNNDERAAGFNNFSIKNYAPFVNYTPVNMIFTDAAAGKKADEQGIMDLGKAVSMQKILYGGDEVEQEILVSNDKVNWYSLTNISEFVTGEWTNSITSQAFRYVNAGGITAELTILTETKEITTLVTGDPIDIYARINHEDAFGRMELSTTSDAVTISGSTIIPVKAGTAEVTLYFVDDDDQSEHTLTLPVTVETYTPYTYTDDLSTTANQSVTEIGAVITGSNWRMRNAAETPGGVLGTHSDTASTPAKIGRNADGIFVDGAYNSVQGYNPDVAAAIPAAVLNADLSELSADHKITFDMIKVHGAVTSAIRFMTHNGGKNYYALIFGGDYYTSNNSVKNWQLIKSVDNELTFLMQGENAISAGSFYNTEITVVDNTISFSVTKDGDAAPTLAASYTDAAMFDVEGNDLGVWLMAMNANGNTSRYAAYKNFTISSYPPYISGYEPSQVVYTDAAEGSVADENGVIRLNTAKPVRRIEANGSGTAYISKDGSRWFTIGELADGTVLNTLTGDDMNYVKIEGSATDIKALTEVPADGLTIFSGIEVTLYPYFDGERTDDITLSATSENLEINGLTVRGVGSGTAVLTAENTLGDSMDITVNVLLLYGADFAYAVNGEDDTKWDFTVTASDLRNTANTILVVFYNEDGSMKDVQVFEEEAFNGIGVASFTANAVELTAGDYGIGYIWDNLTSLKPVATISEIN